MYTPTTNNDYIFSKTHSNNEDMKNSFVNMTDKEKTQYIENFMKVTGQDFSQESRPKSNEYFGKTIATFKNKLYEKEYTRPGEIEFLNVFCDDSVNPYIIPKDLDTFRLLSYNVHSFIKSCNVYLRNRNNAMTDTIQQNQPTDSTHEVIQFIKDCQCDVFGFQEFSPTLVDQDGFLRVRNFAQQFDEPDYVISDCLENGKIMKMFGNAIFSKTKINDKKTIPFQTLEDIRCFIGGVITLGAQNINIFNIHPTSEATNKNDNETQIKTFFSEISQQKKRTNVIVMGDFNTDRKDIHDFIVSQGFVNVNRLLNIISDQTHSGYHGTLIDYIYVSDTFLTNFTPQQLLIPNINLSDHYPLIFDFTLKNPIIEATYHEIWKRYNTQISKLIKISENDTINKLKLYSYNFNHVLRKAVQFGEIINLSDKTYLFHGTSSINFDNTDIPFELNETLSVAKSFTLLHFAGESFSNYYGTNDIHSSKRGIIYKVKDGYTLPVINIFKKLLFHDRIDNRLDFYRELYAVIRNDLIERNIFTVSELIENGDPFDMMRALWLLMGPWYLGSTDYYSSAYNKDLFYGTINSDFILADSAYLNKHITHSRSTDIWKGYEVYEGLEVMIYHPIKFLELVGVYYDGVMYDKQQWITEGPIIVGNLKASEEQYLKDNLLVKIPDIRDIFPKPFPRFYAEKYLVRYIKEYLRYIIALYNNPVYTRSDILSYTDKLLLNIFHRNSFIQQYHEMPALKILVHDFIEQLKNIRYAQFDSDIQFAGSDSCKIISNIYAAIRKFVTGVPDTNEYINYIKKEILQYLDRTIVQSGGSRRKYVFKKLIK